MRLASSLFHDGENHQSAMTLLLPSLFVSLHPFHVDTQSNVLDVSKYGVPLRGFVVHIRALVLSHFMCVSVCRFGSVFLMLR